MVVFDDIRREFARLRSMTAEEATELSRQFGETVALMRAETLRGIQADAPNLPNYWDTQPAPPWWKMGPSQVQALSLTTCHKRSSIPP